MKNTATKLHSNPDLPPRVKGPKARDLLTELPPPLERLIALRDDLADQFQIAMPADRARYILWYMTCGKQDYLATDREAGWDFLCQPETRLAIGSIPVICRLMHILWLQRPDLMETYDLDTNQGRLYFALWFFLYGMTEFKLHSEVILRAVADVYGQPITEQENQILAGMPRLAAVFYFGSPNLQSTFDITKPAGRAGFLRWWISHLPRHQPALMPLIGLMGEWEWRDCPLPDLRHPVVRPGRFEPAAGRQRSGANLIGYLGREMGMGEHIRMSSRAMVAAKADVCLIDANLQPITSLPPHLAHERGEERARFQANIFHVNADQMLPTRLKLGEQFFAQGYNIGYWAWELAKFPKEWLCNIDMVDELWAPSEFIRQALAECTSKPVIHMPLCVDITVDRIYRRKDLGLPEGKFLFLFYFDFHSYYQRKNPLAAIQAFLKAFTDRPDVGLVIKCMNAAPDMPAWTEMKNLIQYDDRVVLINAHFSRNQMISLVGACDGFISLHRSEGFGRAPSEAMMLGKPVVVTAYSGNMDFTRPDNSCLVNHTLVPLQPNDYLFPQGQVWAEPDIDHAAHHMRRLVEEPAFARDIGRQARAFVTSNFSPEAIGHRYRSRLAELGLLQPTDPSKIRLGVSNA